MRIPLVLATGNLHKVRELRLMLKTLPLLDVLSLADFPQYRAPEETGVTFEENAILKATHAATTLNHWTLSDDSGLIVPALQGAPGVYSARYAGRDATDADNRKKLLEEMKDFPEENRVAYQECWLALASSRGVEKIVSGICEGTLLRQEKGGSGFGYDPLFVKTGYGKSFSELGEAVKIRISQRRRAFDKMLPFLQQYILSCIT
jgi:XTP/dITP diphosphohydrolase